MKPKVLILCTANSCRSQMAEGIAQAIVGEKAEIYSAGSMPSFVHPTAIEVLQEIGIDLRSHRSKHIDEFKDTKIDLVITVCSNANSSCPIFLNSTKKQHWPFSDPARATGTPEEIKNTFRQVRDQIIEKFKSDLEVHL